MTDPHALLDTDLGLPLVIDGRVLIERGLTLVLYLRRPTPELVLDFWRKSVAALGPRLTHQRASGAKRPVKRSAKADEMVETWITRPRVGSLNDMTLTGSDQLCSDAMVYVLLQIPPPIPPLERMEQERARLRGIYEAVGVPEIPPVSIFRLSIPLDHELAEPDAFLDFVLGLAIVQSEALTGGHAGLAVHFDFAVALDRQRVPMTSKLAALLARHPGLDLDYPSAIIRHLLRYRPETVDYVPQVKRANWLTLVPTPTLEALGGARSVQERICSPAGSAAEVRDLPGGLLIRAQKRPALGDVTRGDRLDNYRRVGAVLAPLRLERHREIGGALDEERMQQWLEAFDAPPG